MKRKVVLKLERSDTPKKKKNGNNTGDQ